MQSFWPPVSLPPPPNAGAPGAPEGRAAWLSDVTRSLETQSDDVIDVVGSSDDSMVTGIVGRFAIGLDATTSLEPRLVVQAVNRFLEANALVFGGPAPRVRDAEIRVLDDAVHVAYFAQEVGGVSVVDGELTATFARTGELTSLNGPLAYGVVPSSTRMDEAAARVSSMHLHAEGYSVIHRGRVWIFRDEDREVVIDDETAIEVASASLADPGPDAFFGNCSVRSRDVVRNANGNATRLFDAATATTTTTLQCGNDEWFGTYYWHLKRQNTLPNTSYKHEIGRIQDANSAQLEISTTNVNLVPAFTSTAANSLRQQTAFYIQSQMRTFIKQNMWDDVNPEQEYNVHIKIDDTSVGTADFRWGLREIRCNSTTGGCTAGNCCRGDVLAHEYGHYVVATYGDVSGFCAAGVDEGDDLDETLANVHASIFFIPPYSPRASG